MRRRLKNFFTALSLAFCLAADKRQKRSSYLIWQTSLRRKSARTIRGPGPQRSILPAWRTDEKTIKAHWP